MLPTKQAINKPPGQNLSEEREVSSPSAISSHQIGDQIEIVYYHGNVQNVANATLEESPS